MLVDLFVHLTWNDVSETRTTLVTCTETVRSPTSLEGIVGLRELIEKDGAVVRRVVVSFKPVAPDDDGIKRQATERRS